MKTEFVSIIIPTYKDWERLGLCLNMLSKQSYPAELFEIIVVNNNVNDFPPQNFAIPVNCTIVREKKTGSYASRNAGIRLSRGEILGFTDSDCIPDMHWIENAVNFLRKNPACSRVAGKISLFYKSHKLTKAELYESVYAFNNDMYARKDGTSVTANMFTYKNVFNVIGLFNDNLLSGGDYEWSVRAKNAGFAVEYSDEVIINHPARFKMRDLVQKAKRVGGGQAKFMRKYRLQKVSSVARLIYDLRPPIKSIPIIYLKGKDLNVGQKLLVFSLRYYLNVTTAYERFKVRLGKSPQRA